MIRRAYKRFAEAVATRVSASAAKSKKKYGFVILINGDTHLCINNLITRTSNANFIYRLFSRG